MKLFTNPQGSEYVEFSAPRPGKSFTSEVATRDLDGYWSHFYQVLPNPDPVLRKTNNSIVILDEIKRDQRVGPCAISRESGAMLRKWKLEPGNATAASVEIIEKLLKDEKFKVRKVLQEMLTAWGYGFQVSEVVWQRVGNFILPVKIEGKPRRFFMFGKENELRIKQSAADINGTQVDPYKFLLTQYRADFDNPYGEAQYSLCFWPVTLKKGGIKFWAKFLERWGMPHAVGKTSRNAPPKERNELLQSLMLLVQDAAGVFPDDATIELLYGNISGSSDAYERHARFHNSEISTVILGHAGSSESTPGRLGNDDSAMKVRADIIENDCSMVQDTINTLIQWIYEFNPSLGTERPTFELYEETDVDKERSERDTQLINTGKIKLKKDYFVKNYDFDEEDIEVSYEDPAPAVQTPGRASPLPATPAAPKKAPEFAAPATADPQSDIDALTTALLKSDELQTQVESLLKPVFDLFDSAESYEDVKSKLANLYPEMDETQIQKTLEKATFLGEVWGRLNAEKE